MACRSVLMIVITLLAVHSALADEHAKQQPAKTGANNTGANGRRLVFPPLAHEGPTDKLPTIRRLQLERLKTARELLEFAILMSENPKRKEGLNSSVAKILQAQLRVVEARLALAVTLEERIAVLAVGVSTARKAEKTIALLAYEVEDIALRYTRLGWEIRLEREKIKLKKSRDRK